jgi:putative spermidine/putrescine transport system permease protein
MKGEYSTYGIFVIGTAVLGAVFLLLPILVIVYYSIQDGQYFEMIPRGVGFRWYAAALSNERFVAAAIVSFVTAAIVTPIVLVAAVPTAFVLVRGDFPGKAVLGLLVMSPLLVPGVVSGIAFLTFFGVIGIDQGAIRNGLAMICFTYPFAVRAVAANLQGLGLVWEDAAVSLGANSRQVWLLVLLPLLRPGLLAAGIFAFVECVDNFAISVFLVTRASTTLPVEVYSYIRDFDDPSVAVVAVTSIAISTALMFAVERWIGLDRFLRHG